MQRPGGIGAAAGPHEDAESLRARPAHGPSVWHPAPTAKDHALSTTSPGSPCSQAHGFIRRRRRGPHDCAGSGRRRSFPPAGCCRRAVFEISEEGEGQFGEVVLAGARSAEEVALGRVDAEIAQGREVAVTFDALGDDGRTEIQRQQHEGADGDPPGMVIRDTVYEGTVHLDEIGPQLDDVLQ